MSSRADRPYGSFPRSGSEPEPSTAAQPRKPPWRERLRALRQRTAGAQLVGAAVLVTIAILTVASALGGGRSLTERDVTHAVERALASASPLPPAAVAVYQAARPSVVQVRARAEASSARFGGSGVVLDDAGHILTSLHIVDRAAEIRVTFHDGTESAAIVVAARPESDIAVLRARTPPASLIPAVLGDASALRVGDEAIVVSNPFGIAASLSTGSISGLGRSFQAPAHRQPLTGLIQFDAAVNPGSSGGPLLNRDGDVVGIVVGLVNPSGGEVFAGVGFAVPIDVAASAFGVPPD